MSPTALLLTALALLVVLAGVGWDRYIVIHRVERLRLARLVVPAPPPGFARKPASANSVGAESNPFSAFKAMAKKSPSATGTFSLSWSNPSAPNDSATIVVSYVPSPADAATLQAQAEKQFLGSDTFKSQNYVFAASVDVPGVPGARGAVFKAAGTATTPPVAAVAFATGRVQILELMGRAGTPSSTGTAAADLARSEYGHLKEALPGFSLHVTRVPVLASIVFWASVVVVGSLIAAIPAAVRRGRRRRAEARRGAARRQQQVRGNKIARRQARRSRR